MKAFGSTVEVANDEVPVARVRSKGYDAFFGQRFRDGFREVEPAEQNLVTKWLGHFSYEIEVKILEILIKKANENIENNETKVLIIIFEWINLFLLKYIEIFNKISKNNKKKNENLNNIIDNNNNNKIENNDNLNVINS